MTEAGARRGRLAIVIPSLHGHGAERFLSEILPALDRAFEVELILYVREIDYPLPAGVKVEVLGSDTSPDLSLAGKGLRLLRRVAALRRRLARGRFDVVFGLVDMNNVVTFLAARAADPRLPVVVAERTLNENFFRFNPHARRMEKLMRPLLAFVYSRADRVVALSPAMRDFLARDLGVGRAIDVIESGVDLGAFYPAEPGAALPDTLDERFRRARLRLLNVARLDDNKDQAMLLDVLADVRRDHPEAELFLVGVGPNEDKLRSLVAARGMEGVVHLLGWRTDVPDYMRAADVFCLSSHHEGTPRTVLEALACGLPVVATRSTEALPAVLEGDRLGFLVDVGDARGFAAAVRRTITERAGDPAHRRAIAAEARRRFDIDDRARRYVALLDEVRRASTTTKKAVKTTKSTAAAETRVE